MTELTAKLAQGSQAVCLFVNDKITEGVIHQLVENGVKFIALRSAGYKNVDLPAAKAHGLTIMRMPAYSPHAVALILNRKMHKAYNRVREGNFSLERLIGFDLFDKTVGVIGTDKIGDNIFISLFVYFFVSL